ncbi:MAG: tetratricopeptide repeat protein, partial [Pseudomonadota bacterium]
NAKAAALLADRDFPTELGITALLGQIHAELGEFDQAVNAFARLVRARPDNVSARRQLGRSEWQAGRIEAARNSYAMALGIPEGSKSNVLADLVRMESEQGEFERALGYALELQKSYPNISVGNESLGDLYRGASRARDSIPYYQAALEQESTTQGWFGLYQAYVDLDEYENALGVVREWLAATDQDPQVRSVLANTYLTFGDYEDAAREFESIADDYQSDPAFLNNLAYAYHRIGDNRAASVAERAYTALPESAQTSDTLGWILVDTGQDVRRGLLLLQNAADTEPNDPEILYHLGVALAENGRDGESLRYLRRALQLADDFSGADRARELISELDQS